MWIGAALASAALAGAAPAQALVTPPVTIDGPSSEILDFGGVAMAPDGTGGLVYTKAVEGVPHVFASRYAGGSWSAPIRVDWDQPFVASQPRIAAGSGGELLVVWVTPVATVHGQVQYGLYSASVGPGASEFGPSLLVDSNVGEGVGVDPSVAGTAAGKAIVAYRVITYNFNGNSPSTAVQLRPGDVMADIRLARLAGDRWSRIGAINRNSEASMRPPGPANGPQVGVGADGGAVVAWQEPDQTGTARIWVRRVFGTTPGQVLEASPETWKGKPVTDDADAFSLAVNQFNDQARLAIRIDARPGSALGGPRLFLNSLPPNTSQGAGTLSGAELADGGGASPPQGGPGPPNVAASGEGKVEDSLRLAFVSGAQVRQIGIENSGNLVALPSVPGPPAEPDAEPLVADDPEGGGVLAYPALDAQGAPALAVRQEYPSGGAQTGLLSGAQGGPIAEPHIGRSGAGDALVGFRQGEAGRFEIVAERVSVPPAAFLVMAPHAWVRPSRAGLHWLATQSAVGGVTYSVLLDGRIAASGLRVLDYRPPRSLLGSGVTGVRVLATDALGQQLLSAPLRLRVDATPPSVGIRVAWGRGLAAVRVRDRESGLRSGATSVSFGDGTRAHGGSVFRHRYRRPGRYTIAVRARDNVGNAVARRYRVVVR